MVKFIVILTFSLVSHLQVFSQNCDSLVFYEIESLPEFGGSLTKFIANNISYPKTALSDSISGTVYVNFTINEDGKTTNHKILRGVREDLDKEALRVAKLIHFNKPALNRGKPLKYQYVVPVNFDLIKQTEKKEEKERISKVKTSLLGVDLVKGQSPERKKKPTHPYIPSLPFGQRGDFFWHTLADTLTKSPSLRALFAKQSFLFFGTNFQVRDNKVTE